jgi:hypothetical protein
MSSKHLIHLALVLSVISIGSTPGLPSLAAQTPSGNDKPWVQVTSVTIEPGTVHASKQPHTATITVQIILRGQAPPDAKAKVEVATYSSVPPGNNVVYSGVQTVSLKEKLMAVRFTAETLSTSVAGKLTVAASIDETTGGVKIKQPEPSNNWRAELTIAEP